MNFLDLFKRHDICDKKTGSVYLRRWIIFRCRWFRIFVHRIYQADADRHLHNHPWRAVCVVLRGWYVQNRTNGRTYRCVMTDKPQPPLRHRDFIGRYNVLKADEYHRITLVSSDLLTLCIAGPYFRDWGFLVNGKHVDWREYLGLPPDAELED